jgi:hypothetical protein
MMISKDGAGRVGRTVAAAGLLLALAVPVVAAYEGQVAESVSVTTPSGTLPCGTEFPVSATVLDANGQPVTDSAATWSLTTVVSSQDSIVDTTTTTDANGVATTMVWLDCIVGDREIEARVGAAFGGAVLGITSTGLPNTSTPTNQTPPLMLALAGAAVLAGGILGLRSIVARR